MSEYDFDASDESVEAAVTAAYEQARREEEDAEARAQYINFGILIGVFVVVVLVVALAAPFITQRIVAAVMGENLPQAVIINEVMEENAAPEMEEEAYPVENEAVMEDTAVSEEAPVEAAPAATPQTHTVQAGDTLYSIARQYNVAVDDLIDANSIPNPNNIPVNTVLTIPDP